MPPILLVRVLQKEASGKGRMDFKDRTRKILLKDYTKILIIYRLK